MRRMDIFKVIVIVFAVLASLYYLFPTWQLLQLAPEEREKMDSYKLERMKEKTINLGLDLQGGMHLVLEVDKSKLTKDAAKDALARTIEVIRNRVDDFGVSEPIIQKQGESRIIVELPGMQDKQRAKELIGRTALLEFCLVEDPELFQETIEKIDLALSGSDADSGTDGTVAAAGTEPAAKKAEAEKAADEDTLEDLSAMLAQDEKDSASVAAGAEDKPFSAMLVRFSRDGDLAVAEEHVGRVKKMLADPEVQKVIPLKSQLLWGNESREYDGRRYFFLYMLRREPELTGAGIEDARPETGGGQDFRTSGPYVSLEMNEEGADIFARVTGAHIKDRLAIVLDKKIHSAPVIQSRIPHGRAQITGSFTMDDAQDLAIVLRSGALPAPVKIIQERTIGPSLGQDSIDKSLVAALAGMLVVLLFVIIYYKGAGLLANAALILNILFIMAILAAFHATLTLPGIAGIILTIGMAIDANVLIFERIREELALGKTIRNAIDTGYSRAFRTILDANVTTFITAVVLYQFGTGPIRGFAVTLSIGIMASMFSALVFTRVVFDSITAKYNIKKLSI